MSETPTETSRTTDEREREKASPIAMTAEKPSTREAAPKKPFFYSPIIDTD